MSIVFEVVPMSIYSLFSSHPESVGENYGQHFTSAMKFSCAMAVGCIVCLAHALLPFLFERTGSRIVEHLHRTMVAHRSRAGAAVPASEHEPA